MTTPSSELTDTDRPEDAVPVPAEDITELVLEDHSRMRLMFLRLEDVRHDLPVLAARWQRLAQLLELHASTEEETFYPRLLTQGSNAAEDETDDAIGDHDEIRDAIRAAGRETTGSDEWWQAVREARRANSEHLHEEETEALPDFRANSTAAERAQLATHWRAFRSRHPHAAGLSGDDKDPQAYIEAHS